MQAFRFQARCQYSYFVKKKEKEKKEKGNASTHMKPSTGLAFFSYGDIFWIGLRVSLLAKE